MVENHMSDTITLYRISDAILDTARWLLPDIFPVELEAIPWCTTHHLPDLFNDGMCADSRVVSLDECSISQGGPDHKWWKTT